MVAFAVIVVLVTAFVLSTTFLVLHFPKIRPFILTMAKNNSGDSKNLVSVDYEVFGKVQGVFFRKHTNEKARELKLVGWVMNTFHDTVKGNIQGPKIQVEKMKKWLSNVGSPSSRIDKCIFSDEEEIPQIEHKIFRIIR